MLSKNPVTSAGTKRRRTGPRENHPGLRRGAALGCVLVALLGGGCTAAHYKKSADKEVYRIIESGETNVLKRTTGFNIDTPYSKRKPDDLKPAEIIADRSGTGEKNLEVEEALRVAVANSRTYQFNKEKLYLSALNLTERRYDFSPQPFANSTGTLSRNPSSPPSQTASRANQNASLESRGGVDQFFRSGAKLTAVLANDVVSYYVGNKGRSAVSTMSVSFVQPLLRGAGAAIVAESLTQAERNVIYEIRTFSRFQTTFAVDVVTAYLRLLQQKDTVRNRYGSYQSSELSRDRMEASSDRQPRVQIDQARQKELTDRNNYLAAVDAYKAASDDFKQLLCLPLTMDLRLDERAIEELKTNSLPPLKVTEEQAVRLALEQRLDLINAIDQFEDAQRKIKVAADGFKMSLDLFSGVGIESDKPTDYTKFTWDNYHANVGLRLNLPIDRFTERNVYRASFITFERQIRSLALTLDDLRDTLRTGLRQLELTRNSYEIQRKSVELADQRVESAELLMQFGRIQIRDLLDAQNDQLSARLAFTKALIDYYVARMGLLRDMGVLDVDQEKFWVRAQSPLQPDTAPAPLKPGDKLITPEQLFGSKQ